MKGNITQANQGHYANAVVGRREMPLMGNGSIYAGHVMHFKPTKRERAAIRKQESESAKAATNSVASSLDHTLQYLENIAEERDAHTPPEKVLFSANLPYMVDLLKEETETGKQNPLLTELVIRLASANARYYKQLGTIVRQELRPMFPTKQLGRAWEFVDAQGRSFNELSPQEQKSCVANFRSKGATTPSFETPEEIDRCFGYTTHDKKGYQERLHHAHLSPDYRLPFSALSDEAKAKFPSDGTTTSLERLSADEIRFALQRVGEIKDFYDLSPLERVQYYMAQHEVAKKAGIYTLEIDPSRPNDSNGYNIVRKGETLPIRLKIIGARVAGHAGIASDKDTSLLSLEQALKTPSLRKQLIDTFFQLTVDNKRRINEKQPLPEQTDSEQNILSWAMWAGAGLFGGLLAAAAVCAKKPKAQPPAALLQHAAANAANGGDKLYGDFLNQHIEYLPNGVLAVLPTGASGYVTRSLNNVLTYIAKDVENLSKIEMGDKNLQQKLRAQCTSIMAILPATQKPDQTEKAGFEAVIALRDRIQGFPNIMKKQDKVDNQSGASRNVIRLCRLCVDLVFICGKNDKYTEMNNIGTGAVGRGRQ